MGKREHEALKEQVRVLNSKIAGGASIPVSPNAGGGKIVTVHVKDLKNVETKVEVSSQARISELKKLVATQMPQYPSDSQALLFSGNMLKDNQTVEECKLEDQWVVVSTSK